MSKEKYYQMSNNDRWRTPQPLLDEIETRLPGGIHTDPAAAPDTNIGSLFNYTIEDDGLSNPWIGNTFANPPFSRKGDFLEKAVEESQKEYCGIVLVVTPDCTDVKSVWHEYIDKHAKYVWFRNGRLNYDPPPDVDPDEISSPTFGTAISMYGNEPPMELLEWFDENGDLRQKVKFNE